MMLTRSVFRRMDIFGSRVGLTFNKNNSYMSGLGGAFSLTVIVLMTVFFWTNITSLLNKSNVEITTGHVYDRSPRPMELNKNKFMFAIQVDQENFIKNPYFHVQMTYWRQYTSENGKKQKKQFRLQLEPCTKDHFKDLPSYKVSWDELFNLNSLQNYLCPKLDYNVTISGDYTSPIFEYVRISIGSCLTPAVVAEYAKLPWQPKCRGSTEIAAFVKSSPKFMVYFSNIIINPSEPTNYKQSMLNSDNYFFFQPGLVFKSANIMFTEYNVKTDESLTPFKEIVENQYIRFENNDFREQIYFGDNEFYAHVYFRRSYITANIERQFEKIDEVISYIGGFVEAFLIILEIIIGYYNECLFQIDLANKLFDFEKPNDHNHNKTAPMPSNNNYPSDFKRGSRQSNMISPRGKIDRVKCENLPLTQNQELQEQTQDREPNTQDNESNIQKRNDLRILAHTHGKERPKELDVNNLNNIRNQLRTNYNQMMKFETESNAQDRGQNKKIDNDDLFSPTKSQIFNSHRQSLVSPIPILKNIMSDRKLYLTSPKYGDQVNQNGFSQDDVVQSTNIFNLRQGGSKVTFTENANEEAEPIKMVTSHTLHSSGNKINSQTNIVFKNTSDEALRQKQQDQVYQGRESSRFKQEGYEPEQQLQSAISEEQKKASKQEQDLQATKVIQSFFSSRREPASQRVQYLKSEFEKILSKNTKIIPDGSYFFYKISCHKACRTKENLLLTKGVDMVEDEVDIPSILNRLKQIEKLKELFLDKQQQILFNFFPKPVVQLKEVKDSVQEVSRENFTELSQSISSIKKQNLRQMHSMKSIGIVASAVNRFRSTIQKQDTQFQSMRAYQKLYDCFVICEKDKNSIINKKLIGMLGNEINTIFNKSKDIQRRHPTMRPRVVVSNFMDRKFDNSQNLSNMSPSIKNDTNDYQYEATQISMNRYDNQKQSQSPIRRGEQFVHAKMDSQQMMSCESPELMGQVQLGRFESTQGRDPLITNQDFRLTSHRKTSFSQQTQEYLPTEEILHTQPLDSAKPLYDDLASQSPLRKQKIKSLQWSQKQKVQNFTQSNQEQAKQENVSFNQNGPEINHHNQIDQNLKLVNKNHQLPPLIQRGNENQVVLIKPQNQEDPEKDIEQTQQFQSNDQKQQQFQQQKNQQQQQQQQQQNQKPQNPLNHIEEEDDQFSHLSKNAKFFAVKDFQQDEDEIESNF